MSEPVSETTPEMPTHGHIIALLLEHRADTIRRLDHGEKRMGNIEAELLMNTEITKEIRDAVTTGKMMTRLLKWVAGVAAASAAIWAAALTFVGRPPTPPV